MVLNRRLALVAVGAVALLPADAAPASAQSKLVELRMDWATYNPVSILIKNQRLQEKEFERDGTKVRWVQTLGSNKALELLNTGSIDFGSTAGAAALVGKIDGNPIKSIYVYSRPDWPALVLRTYTGTNHSAALTVMSTSLTP